MIHLFDHTMFGDNTSKSDRIIIILFSLLSGVWSFDFLFWMESVEHIVKWAMGVAGMGIGAVVVTIFKTFYERNLKDKIFKPRKDETEKTKKGEDEKRA